MPDLHPYFVTLGDHGGDAWGVLAFASTARAARTLGWKNSPGETTGETFLDARAHRVYGTAFGIPDAPAVVDWWCCLDCEEARIRHRDGRCQCGGEITFEPL